MDDRKAALQLLGCLLTRPLQLGLPVIAARVVGPLDLATVAERLAECDIADLDPSDPSDKKHIETISAIFADLVNNLAKSSNAPPNVINCIVAFVQPGGGS